MEPLIPHGTQIAKCGDKLILVHPKYPPHEIDLRTAEHKPLEGNVFDGVAFFPGPLVDIRTYDRKLNRDEILKLKNRTIP